MNDTPKKLNEQQLDRLLSGGELSPAEIDKGWDELRTQLPLHTHSWLGRLLQSEWLTARRLAPVAVAACMLLAFAMILTQHPKDEEFVVRGGAGGTGFFAQARCIPDCRPGNQLVFELGETPKGYLLAWVLVSGETTWLYPDSNGFAPQISPTREPQVIPRAITIPSTWKGTIDIAIAISHSANRQAREQALRTTTIQLHLLEPEGTDAREAQP